MELNIGVGKLLLLKLNRKINKGELTEEEANRIIDEAARMYAIERVTDDELTEIVTLALENIID